MRDYSEFYAARDIIGNILKKDFIGPIEEKEKLKEQPAQYYIMGKLYPQNNHYEELVDLTHNSLLDNGTDTYDTSIVLSNQNNPSSMGITFTLKKEECKIRITGSYGRYDLIHDEMEDDPKLEEKKAKQRKNRWCRQHYVYDHIITFSKDTTIYSIKLSDFLELNVYTNQIVHNGERVVTAVLVNTAKAAESIIEQNSQIVFQPVINISGTDGVPIFATIDKRINLEKDPELIELDMLYQDNHCYAQGHGCSAVWDLENEEPLWVASSFFPSYNLLQMKSVDIGNLSVFNMKYLYTAPSQKVIDGLYQFIKQYEKWIQKISNESRSFMGNRRHAADSNINKCKIACDRIKRAVQLLEKDAKTNGIAYRAFQLTNEAMFTQRKKTLFRSGHPIEPETINWYPFQLAFILYELSSFIDPKGNERDKVDLLWFPTGGGKTEAYLGVAAFTIFLRRLRKPGDDGVTVIMRYTLRLLTLQQFERASQLICSCELLRQKYNMGGPEISIGLWVGDQLTPNDLNVAYKGLQNEKNNGNFKEDTNPCQIKICPWCGQVIDPSDYEIDFNKKRMFIHCPNEKCEFHNIANGIPVHIIDEAIYKNLPTFLVATIDKFAQIPLSEKPAALFGITSDKNPPELIIQDELHLIAGPLGTMTGIYEAAITEFCENNGIKAKIIASTATIRNASNQINALYGRSYTQFPPQGISMNDSFFAKISTPEEKPARLYCGVMGTGTTATTTFIRVNAALLFATRYLGTLNFDPKVIDNYWTITDYFNSLRELGGASIQIIDDVQSRFRYLAETKFATEYPGVKTGRHYIANKELTSRMDNTDITKVIQRDLKRSYPSNDALDFILATNMISVGVDVGRLGAMTVAGQPKTNAEYIQATSRVGRDNPGIVLTVFNAARSRDRSHYEQFLKYHSSLYKYVEAASLTPFSDRARDRGLHALFVSLCRYTVHGLIKNDEAGNFCMNDPEIAKIKEMILNYVAVVDPAECENVRKELDYICESWQDQASSQLVYKSYDEGIEGLLQPDTKEDRFRTMNSMRNVDKLVNIGLVER